MLCTYSYSLPYLIDFQVVRYTALLTGVFYGITHRRSLQKTSDAEKLHHAVHEREHLISQAKEAWKRKQESAKGSKDGGESPVSFGAHSYVHPTRCVADTPCIVVVTDPEDPKFDLEKLFAKWEADAK